MRERLQARSATRAPVLELFASIQGEGLHAGRAQLFLRLRGCPLRCKYCDTPGSWPVHAPSADHSPLEWDASECSEQLERLDPTQRKALSVTGGEPLLWVDFLEDLSADLGRRAFHLETAGAHAEALERLLPLLDHVSLDLKLAEDLDAPMGWGGEHLPRDAQDWRELRARLLPQLCSDLRRKRGADATGKLVVMAGQPPEAYAALLDEVARHAPRLPVCIQPASPVRGLPAGSVDDCLQLVDRALALGLDVRLLPQLHRFLELR